MSLLTPERVPVKVYRWDDEGAPALDKTAGCVATIFKACLVTGYGKQEPAGWTMPFEDTKNGIKVFRPAINPRADFYLRVSADTGAAITPQIYTDMTDANTGELKLQCSTPFKYSSGAITGKWTLIVSPVGLWFSCESHNPALAFAKDYLGAYMYIGYVKEAMQTKDALLLMHSGGRATNECSGIVHRTRDSSYFVNPVMYSFASNKTVNVVVLSQFDSFTPLSSARHTCSAVFFASDEMYLIAGIYAQSTGFSNGNGNAISTTQGDCVEYGVSTYEQQTWLIGSDYWEY